MPSSSPYKQELLVGNNVYHYFSIPEAASQLGRPFDRLPHSLKVLLENSLRLSRGVDQVQADLEAFQNYLVSSGKVNHEIAFTPSRVLMQDFTGVPAVVDLAAMRDAMADLGKDPQLINPLRPVSLVIDHSVMVDAYASSGAFNYNVEKEFERNQERYRFLRWGATAFQNLEIVPPGTGICHQVNIEYLAKTVWTENVDGEVWAYPDSLVGTDSHTTMVNGMAVLGWGVGGIEAEAAMLGQPISMLIPEVVGVYLSGEKQPGITATDVVLAITEALRKLNVVGKIVEFFGPGVSALSLEDRVTISNMAPEYGATASFFPIDENTLNYLELTGRSPEQIDLVRAYAQAQGLWFDPEAHPIYTQELEISMSGLEPCLAGPKRPQDRVLLKEASSKFDEVLREDLSIKESQGPANSDASQDLVKKALVPGQDYAVEHGDVVIAAITSCTNTSNPSVMIAAGLVARKARERGLTVKPWVKTSLAPGSQVVQEYLNKAGLQEDLDAQGFNIVGFGCTTCIGNSGPLRDDITQAITEHDLRVCSVLSGNRNFEGRVHPLTRMNYLASPPLVVAYALAGTMKLDLATEPLGLDSTGAPVFLKDIWPSDEEVAEVLSSSLTREMFSRKYSEVALGPQQWQDLETPSGATYAWDENSTYIRKPSFFDNLAQDNAVEDIHEAAILALFGDSITTDHISPAGVIKADSPAGTYLKEHHVTDFNSYGARRGNHEVMVRGTFANIRIRNLMNPQREGGFTTLKGEVVPIYEAAQAYAAQNKPLVVLGGREYGTGSSRDWAAKGTKLLGVKAVITESFERIHRSNLVGMGVLPCEFTQGNSIESLGLTGDETLTIRGISELEPRSLLTVIATRSNGEQFSFEVQARVDTGEELQYFTHGGILNYVLASLGN